MVSQTFNPKYSSSIQEDLFGPGEQFNDAQSSKLTTVQKHFKPKIKIYLKA